MLRKTRIFFHSFHLIFLLKALLLRMEQSKKHDRTKKKKKSCISQKAVFLDDHV